MFKMLPFIKYMGFFVFVKHQMAVVVNTHIWSSMMFHWYACLFASGILFLLLLFYNICNSNFPSMIFSPQDCFGYLRYLWFHVYFRIFFYCCKECCGYFFYWNCIGICSSLLVVWSFWHYYFYWSMNMGSFLFSCVFSDYIFRELRYSLLGPLTSLIRFALRCFIVFDALINGVCPCYLVPCVCCYTELVLIFFLKLVLFPTTLLRLLLVSKCSPMEVLGSFIYNIMSSSIIPCYHLQIGTKWFHLWLGPFNL